LLPSNPPAARFSTPHREFPFQDTGVNVLTVDVEDYFHVEAFAEHIPQEQWLLHESRVERNVTQILELFARYKVQATFFMLGWVAEKFPGLSRRIAAAGHEIGCHGFAHQRLQRLTPDQFRLDVRKATRCLQDQIQQPIRCYRAPSFSIVKSTLWAFDILAEEGFTIDSSIFPVRHDLYGIPDGQRFPHLQKTLSGNSIFEFPPSTIRYGNTNWGIAGGGYLRFIPYEVTLRALRHINGVESQPAMIYFHPWEIDPDQPRIHAGLRSRVRHYTNLAGTLRKIERLLQDFQFTTLSNVCARYNAYQSVKPKHLTAARSVASGK
jgi:polysaccharide deacetylase family protein (PEP-CTERM system associated)